MPGQHMQSTQAGGCRLQDFGVSFSWAPDAKGAVAERIHAARAER